jgi:hypothetical protein
VILPEAVLKKVYRGETLTPENPSSSINTRLWRFDLIAKIPRMTRVAVIIKYQDKYYDGVGLSGDRR